jgi:hypothetical protein
VNDQITQAASLGTVGLNWAVAGFGDFNGDGTTDMMLRNASSGEFLLYSISNNSITAASSVGTVGLEWQVAGFGPISGAGKSDMVLRNVNTGAFEVYNFANNQISGAALLGTVGLNWQLAGFAPDPAAGSVGSSDGQLGSTSQLVQAMAGFGGGSGAADGLNTGLVSADTSQQQLLTTPQHA